MNRVALVLFALVVAMLAPALALGFGVEPAFDLVGWHLLAAVLATIGLLVASRHPSNPIGWLFLALAVVQGVSELGQAYADRSARNGMPAGEIADWVTSWIWILQPALLMIVLVLFPGGRLASRRSRAVPVLAVAGCALAAPGLALSPWTDEQSTYDNPFAVGAPVIELLVPLGMVVLMAALLASAVALVFRFRRARGVERQQLKWVAFAALVGPLMMAASAAFWPAWWAEAVTLAGFSLIPIAAGIAILRHRLYDIDIVVNRTLVYGALTATLALTYLGGVLVLQLMLSGLTEGSGLPVAASTLGVAALFRPVRARIQQAVDRRFYRRKYDAATTLRAFGAQLRDEVDIDALAGDLRAVVAETMQPAHVSLWLRAPEAGR